MYNRIIDKRAATLFKGPWEFTQLRSYSCPTHRLGFAATVFYYHYYYYYCDEYTV